MDKDLKKIKNEVKDGLAHLLDVEGFELINGKLCLTKQTKERMKNHQCIKCGTPMINITDSITKDISKYLWKHNCKCLSENIVLANL